MWPARLSRQGVAYSTTRALTTARLTPGRKADTEMARNQKAEQPEERGRTEEEVRRERRQVRIGILIGRGFLGALLGAVIWTGSCLAAYGLTTEEAIDLELEPEPLWAFNPFYFGLFVLAWAVIGALLGGEFFRRLSRPPEE